MKKLIGLVILGATVSSLLTGCIVAPIGPGYYHPRYYHPYDRY